MTVIDLWATVMAFFASACLGLRSYMLKPSMAAWCSAPTTVWLALFGASVVLAAAGLNIMGEGTATAREAATYTAIAFAASVMLVNLHRQMLEARDKPKGTAS